MSEGGDRTHDTPLLKAALPTELPPTIRVSNQLKAPIDGHTGLSVANQQTFHKCSLDTCTLPQRPERTPRHKSCETYMSWIAQVDFFVPASGAGQELSHREGTECSIQLVSTLQMRKESNLQPMVLETIALPLSYALNKLGRRGWI